ncbi:hypothetical protein D3C74_274070 [compost metagenome]
MVVPVRVQMLRAAFLGVHPLRRMQVDRPAAERDPVLERLLRQNVVLGQRVVAEKAAVFPLAGDRADPFQGHAVGVELSGIFDVIPNSVDNGRQLVADALVVMHGVQLAAPFDPPVMATRVAAADDTP